MKKFRWSAVFIGTAVILSGLAFWNSIQTSDERSVEALLFGRQALPAHRSLEAIPDARASDRINIFVKLAKKVVPSVVNISTFTYARGGGYGGMQNDLLRKFLEEFFGGPGGPMIQPPHQGPGPQTGPRVRRPQSLGSGFIISEDGLILTNHHVVGDAEEIKVKFTEDPNEKQTEAEVIGRDPELDLALIKVNVKRKLIPLPIGNSESLQVGEYVVAVGNPFGRGHSVTHGIVSAKGREAPGLLANYIQTDAPINPGNSGGPLINLDGEVIGINNAIDARAQGIGFAIPSNLAKKVLPQLKDKGGVERGYIGVNIAQLEPKIAEQVKAPKNLRAPFVVNVQPGEPADKAGMKPYDIIMEVDGKRVQRPFELTQAITAIPVGDKAKIKVLRQGKEKTLSVRIGKRPTLNQLASGPQSPRRQEGKKTEISTGMALRTLDSTLARRMGLSKETRGVVVTDVEIGSPADEADLARGDVIVEIDQKPIRSVTQFNKIVRKKKSYLLRVLRMTPRGDEIFMVMVLKLK